MRNKKENKMRGSGKSLYYIFVPKSSLAGTSNPLLIPQIKKKKKKKNQNHVLKPHHCTDAKEKKLQQDPAPRIPSGQEDSVGFLSTKCFTSLQPGP